MKTTDYVSYDLAIKLKECGFDWPCDRVYHDGVKLLCSEMTLRPRPKNWNELRGKTSAPTLAQAAKWLRIVKNCFVEVQIILKDCYSFDLYDTRDNILYTSSDCSFDDPEAALSAGIAFALNFPQP